MINKNAVNSHHVKIPSDSKILQSLLAVGEKKVDIVGSNVSNLCVFYRGRSVRINFNFFIFNLPPEN